MKKIVQGRHIHAYPGMVAVVTSHFNGARNAMASGWHSYIGSDPETYGVSIRRETFSYGLIEKGGAFGVNFLSADRAKTIQSVGTLSGSQCDKFELPGMAYEDGGCLGVPILSDAYLSYECELIDANDYGDHVWLVGKISQVYKDEDCFNTDGSIDLSKVRIPLYIGRSTYRILNDEVELCDLWGG